MVRASNHILLYDYTRDVDLQPGQAVLVFNDGKTRRVRESSLYQKEIDNVRISTKPQSASAIRSISVRAIKHRNKHVKRPAARKRSAIYQA